MIDHSDDTFTLSNVVLQGHADYTTCASPCMVTLDNVTLHAVYRKFIAVITAAPFLRHMVSQLLPQEDTLNLYQTASRCGDAVSVAWFGGYGGVLQISHALVTFCGIEVVH